MKKIKKILNCMKYLILLAIPLFFLIFSFITSCQEEENYNYKWDIEIFYMNGAIDTIQYEIDGWGEQGFILSMDNNNDSDIICLYVCRCPRGDWTCYKYEKIVCYISRYKILNIEKQKIKSYENKKDN